MIFRNRNKEKNISRQSLFKQKQISKFRSRQNIKHRNIDNVKILPAYITLIYIYFALQRYIEKLLIKNSKKSLSTRQIPMPSKKFMARSTRNERWRAEVVRMFEQQHVSRAKGGQVTRDSIGALFNYRVPRALPFRVRLDRIWGTGRDDLVDFISGRVSTSRGGGSLLIRDDTKAWPRAKLRWIFMKTLCN